MPDFLVMVAKGRAEPTIKTISADSKDDAESKAKDRGFSVLESYDEEDKLEAFEDLEDEKEEREDGGKDGQNETGGEGEKEKKDKDGDGEKEKEEQDKGNNEDKKEVKDDSKPAKGTFASKYLGG